MGGKKQTVLDALHMDDGLRKIFEFFGGS